MDKRLFDKSSNFFKKEGFYVVLFVCLCIVATVATLAARNSRSKENPPVVQEQKKPELSTDVASNSESEVKSNIPNALEVKNNSEPSKAISVPTNGSASAVSKTVDNTFAKPVSGELVRPYTTDTVYCETIGTYKTNNGIEIKAKLDSPVSAVLDGKVEKIADDGTELGQYVVISHQNGLKTIYANLNKEVSVKVGDTVKKGSTIGKVGNTRESYSEEKFGDHLHFEVMNGKDYVDPSKYVSYAVVQNQ